MKELYDQNPEKAIAALDEMFQDEQKYKSSWARKARQCVAFANGDQTYDVNAAPIMVNNQPVTYSSTYRQNAYQSNEIEPIIRTLTSFMTRAKPAVNIYPDGEDEQAKNIAEIARKVNDAKYDLDNELDNTRASAWWALVIGEVYAKDFWDTTRGYAIDAQDENGNLIVNEYGQPLQTKTGNNNCAILTPFSITVDHSVLDWEEQPFIGESYLVDVDWAKEAFDQTGPGYTGKAQAIVEDDYTAETLTMLEDMKFSIPKIGSTQPKKKGKCLVQEWNVRPNYQWRRGRFLIKAGGQVVYSSKQDVGSPYFMELEPVMWHDYSRFGYEPYIGRFLHKSLVEQLIPLQVRLNEINGAILENANTLAKPNIAAPVNSLKKGVVNGKGANIYTYQGPVAPTIFNGVSLPEQFFKERQLIIDQMVRLAGTNFVMQGQAPAGVSAAIAIERLLENANSQHSDMMGAWEKYHESRYTKKLRIIHKFHRHRDKSLEKYVRMFAKDETSNKIRDFIGVRDLSDGLILKIESGSQIPKSEAARKELYKDFAKEGLLGPLTENSPQGAKLREQLLERMGEKPFDTEEMVEVKKAKWENDRLKKKLPVEVSKYDNDDIHISYHVADLQDPKFLESAEDAIKIATDNHIQEHEKQKADKIAAQNPQPAEATPEEVVQPLGNPQPEMVLQ